MKEIGTAGASAKTGSNTGNGGSTITNGIAGGANGSISGSTVSSNSDGRLGPSSATPTATTSGAGKEARKTRNLESYVKWFNRLCYIISSDVCKVFIPQTTFTSTCFSHQSKCSMCASSASLSKIISQHALLEKPVRI